MVRRFGEVAPGSLGLEEELIAVDARTLEPARVPAELFDGARRKQELFDCMLELTTSVCSTADEALAELRALRTQAGAALEPHGLRLLAAGTHPLGDPARQRVLDVPAMQDFLRYGGPATQTQLCCGVHVHVAVASAQECMAAVERALPWLPALLALSANSPYFDGRETGYASTRAELLSRLPRSGAPPAYATIDDWQRFAGTLVELGLADDYTRIWWDIRPHPRLGTVEVRIADQPTDPVLGAAVAALLQALVLKGGPAEPSDRAVYAQNRFAAQRFGARAELIHPDGGRLASPAELLEALLARLEPELGLRDAGSLVETLAPLARETQADVQLAHGRDAGLESLCRRLVEETEAAARADG